ncbi:hypothetical protein EYF80_011764 [Liparis tanakae]|uniref:Uncharacterized protein n=1 Tax=Liparis tanakae TaxID=230148 RepID=A0A4Z2IJ18_9TELE|nr:hypothetical protein EYF80_011764 [Liparis tanakae]
MEGGKEVREKNLDKLMRPLTDVVVLLSDVELVAQREGAVALELLRELDGRVGRVGPVALPPLEAQLRVAVPVAAVADHVEDVLLAGAHHALAVVVVRAVDVQLDHHSFPPSYVTPGSSKLGGGVAGRFAGNDFDTSTDPPEGWSDGRTERKMGRFIG